MNKLKLILITFIMFVAYSLNAQDISNTVRGQIIEKQTQSPLPGATVILSGSDPLLATVTDNNGYFILENIQTGRISLQISYVGFNTINLSNLNHTSGKELIINAEMEEKIQEMDEVIISGYKKGETINKNASISARTFSVEESQRYAGARNDVSRMAANYAGVCTSNDALNDIVIRGNSPNGLLWRLEGVDIPNPNHFGHLGATGGPVSMLNNNVLSNSDFMTGAFPAEYGNSYSGVFDLKLRNGNYEKHEFLGQIGFNGFEVGAEGPIFKKINSSYLINYRYSTMGVLQALGISVGTGSAVPNYQDLTFKFNFPTKILGKITIFGLGGISDINFLYSQRDTTKDNDNAYTQKNFDVISKSKMGVIGLSHTYIINKNTYSKLIIGASSMNTQNILDSVSTATNIPGPYVRMNLTESKIFGNFFINTKINSHHNFRVGVNVKRINLNLIDSVYKANYDRFVTRVDKTDFTWLYEAFVQWQYKLTDNLTFNPGVHYQQLALNKTYSIEPRFGIKWSLSDKQSLGLAYGLHSITQPLNTYFKQVELPDMGYSRPNENLDFTKSHHFVLGYNHQISKNIRLKAEAYYQNIFQTAVESKNSAYSILNTTSFSRVTPDSLINGGSGRNYGIELTLERFMDKGFYYLLTGSLYESKYKGSDGILRNTAFNGNYVVNALIGKEFEIFSKNGKAKYKKVLAIDGKLTWAGGLRYTPVDIQASVASGETKFDETKPFSNQFSDYIRPDIRIAFRIDGKNVSQEIGVDMQNFISRKNPYSMTFDVDTGQEKMIYQLGLYTMVQYRIIF